MKKTIKGLLIFMLIGSMLFVLTGCGDKESAKKEDEEEIVEQKQETNVEEIAKAEFSMGEWNGKVYSNDFLGIKYNLPEGWTYSSDEEIAEMMNVGVELLNDDQKASAEIAKLTSVYYMVASNQSTGDSVTIISEKPATKISAENYINQLKAQLQAVQSISYKIDETSKEKISNIETNTLSVTGTMSGIDVAQKYYIYNIDEHIACVIITSTAGHDMVNEIAKDFE